MEMLAYLKWAWSILRRFQQSRYWYEGFAIAGIFVSFLGLHATGYLYLPDALMIHTTGRTFFNILEFNKITLR